ncbi:hypothetical protein [Jiangella alkaliphila]|uniref:Uncharacterized protein n=1 Tax=Jiangella alkaliphila TaxID=419479 RepID=A0A1H2JVM4_9ACTN|nr:hypothetical protein [Jiangella alkaliphila]SDU60135.1 hypothetical protein SAMN04488563_3100 [Jiangella alkaliphila]
MTAAAVPPGALGPVLPGWALRPVLAVALAVTMLGVAGWASASPFALLVAALIGVSTVALPASHAATAFLAVCALCGLAADGAITGWLSLAVLGAHATHVTAALAAVVPVRARVERAALLPTLRRFAMAQAAGQLLVLLAWAVS